MTVKYVLETQVMIQLIREEASEVKQCFNSYSFKSLTATTITLGAVLGFVGSSHRGSIEYVGIPVVFLLMVVSRVGIYKYLTANRNYGYELHLARLRALVKKNRENVGKRAVYEEMASVSWEEALKAWRIVATAIFQSLYVVPEDRSYRAYWLRWFDTKLYTLKAEAALFVEKYSQGAGRPDEKDVDCGKYPWFRPRALTIVPGCEKSPSPYHAGSYLSNMLAIMKAAQYMLLLPLLISPFSMARSLLSEVDLKSIHFASAVSTSDILLNLVLPLSTALITAELIRRRWVVVDRRRRFLEEDIHSIHSCAITWQAVILAHCIAMKGCDATLAHYTEKISEIACGIRKNHALRVHEWMDRQILAMARDLPPGDSEVS